MGAKRMNPVVHFEMPAEDSKRMSDFYTNVFGWRTQNLGPEMGNYVLAMTTESDENGPKRPGVINGGFFPKSNDRPAQYPSVVIAVENIREHMKKVEEAEARCLESRGIFPASDSMCPFLIRKATG
jgi:uncharacterized protein